jgi:peptidoglycan/LPS O-acetylase OafA/YrhL
VSVLGSLRRVTAAETDRIEQAEEQRAVAAAPADRIEQAGERRSARIESLRALAALAVFVGHSFALSFGNRPGVFTGTKNQLLVGGGLGVFLFFTLSGYLLFLPFLRAQVGARDRVELKDYARNRVLRILPLYVAVVTVLSVLRPFDGQASDWWRFMLFVHNYSGQSITLPDSPVWSLQVEMHYYLLLPLAAFLLALVARRSLGVTAVLLLIVAAVSYKLRAHGVQTRDSLGVLYGLYSLPGLMYLFVSGMLVAVLKVHADRATPAWMRLPVVGWSSVWLLAGLAGYVTMATHDQLLQTRLLPFAGFLVVGAAVLPLRGGRPVRALEWRPLALVGVASYSLYLVHVPIIQAFTGTHVKIVDNALITVGDGMSFKLTLLLAVLIVAPVTAASYLGIERPFLRLRRRWT